MGQSCEDVPTAVTRQACESATAALSRDFPASAYVLTILGIHKNNQCRLPML
jgi:hypothetical protein